MPTPGYNFLLNDTVTHEKLNQSVSGLTFTEGTISGAALQNLTVTRAKISDLAVDNTKVAVGTLTPDRIVPAVAVAPATNRDGQLLISGLDGVFAAKSLSGGISVAASGDVTLAEKVIQATHLADGAVTSRAIAQGAVQSHHLNTLLFDTSSSAGAYAATLAGVTLTQGLELKLIILRANSSNAGKATLSLNGGVSYRILKPGNGEFAAYELAGGSIINIVWMGGAWQVVSPWVPLVVTETEIVGSGTFPIPQNATRVRIRCWGPGGQGALYQGSFNPRSGYSGYVDNYTRAGGGGGAFAEWSGAPSATGGLLAAGTLLAVTVGGQNPTLITPNADATKTILRCGAGGAGSGSSGGAGGQFDATSLLATTAVLRDSLISANGGVGGRATNVGNSSSFLGGQGSNGWGVGGSISGGVLTSYTVASQEAVTPPNSGKVIIEVTTP